jgi:hypothetical protein
MCTKSNRNGFRRKVKSEQSAVKEIGGVEKAIP